MHYEVKLKISYEVVQIVCPFYKLCIHSLEQQLTEVDEPQLKSIINEVFSTSDLVTQHTNKEWEWPSNDDVITAFSVFDQEGLGFIPVQQLKRFLLQAQLGFQEEECKLVSCDYHMTCFVSWYHVIIT